MIKIKKITNKDSICVGSGLVALDVILNGSPTTPAKLCAGGSCGNVLSILAFLGWNAYPVARLSDNKATDNLLFDLSKFDINTSLITNTADGKTPIIIHRILKDKNGNPKHKFEFRIPDTNTWLPSYKPVLSSSVSEIVFKQKVSDVYYFDRVSRSSIDLAKYYKNLGSLIVFEPSSINDSSQFSECLELADIIKYSHDRISNYTELFPTPKAKLEIETLGKGGLQYRLKNAENQDWKTIPSFAVTNVIDSAGAGDWCTAGIINQLGYNGVQSFNSSSREDVEKALSVGQILGGINCQYDGARGIMYSMNYKSLISLAEAFLNNKVIPTNIEVSGVEIVTIKNFTFDSIL
ncbi:PfkB family carbohydrate kinase [Flavobacterium sp.]|uniref:PfkB family carbohydrate kinase n=1 Tax=Flavobacterium sp. TaxID=239 RepID=UPI0039E621B2